MVKQQVEAVMSREVTRKEFLLMSGLVAGSLVGLDGIIKLLAGHSGSLLTKQPTEKQHGYGASAYGR